jgi:PAS domain S-box-containing protein
MPKQISKSELYDLLLDLLNNNNDFRIPDTIDTETKEFITQFRTELNLKYRSDQKLENQIDEFNNTLLDYAQHKYAKQIGLLGEDDILNSLATSINLLGEELNHSTITKNYLEDIFNSITDMLIVVDEMGYIDSINNATACTLNYPKSKLLHKNIKLILPKGQTFYVFLDEISKNNSATFITKKGELLTVEITVSKFVRGDNKPIGSIIIARNISDMLSYQHEIEAQNKIITRANEELKTAISKIEESDRLKTAFLQNISHEIRTPLNSIIGLTHILNNEPVSDEERNEFSNVIEKSGNRLIDIVNNILEISKIETGQYDVSCEFFPINNLVQEVYNVFYQESLKKQLRLTYTYDFDLKESTIFSDEYVINQVLTNLINNAIKFTHKGEIKFGYKRKGKVLEFYVQDTGIGIAQDQIKNIFDRFTQADTSLSRSHEGAGLGLSICKGIIELLGGKIWVKSRPGKGSTFFFTIPYHPQKHPTIKGEQEQSLEMINKALGKLRILIAEDDDMNYLYFYRILRPGEHMVTRAHTGIEALNFCEDNDYDIIIMDIKMPLMDGIEATKVIREKKPDIPIIALTAFALNEEEVNLKKIGFNDYLTKPLKVEDFFLAIQRALT